MRKPSFTWATMRGPLSPLLSYTVAELQRMIGVIALSPMLACGHRPLCSVARIWWSGSCWGPVGALCADRKHPRE